MDIETFFTRIDRDLRQYFRAFRKLGFTSIQTMKFWPEEYFENLDVDVPEGHRRLKAVFQLRVFHTYVHARKTLNPFQYYI